MRPCSAEDDVRSAAPSARVPGAYAGIAVLVFLVALFLRSPKLFIEPRMWAEEASLYAAKLQSLPVLGSLSLVIKGNYQLCTNLIVEAALAVPLGWSALVTTYTSLAVMLVCIWGVARRLAACPRPLPSAVMAALLLAFQPAGYEVALTATNVQWTLSLLALTLCVSANERTTGRRACLKYALVLFCGLSGPPSCILTPAFLVGAWHRRSPFGWVMLVSIALATSIQAVVIAVHRDEVASRPLDVSAILLISLVVHSSLVELMPISAVDRLVPWLSSPSISAVLVCLGLVFLIIVGVLGRSVLGWRASLMMGGATFATILNEVGSLDPLNRSMGGMSGLRYDFLLNSCVVILVSAAAFSRLAAHAVTARVVAAVIALNFSTGMALGRWRQPFLEGPSFSAQVAGCAKGRPCHVEVWPAGQGFTVDFDDRRQPPRLDGSP